MVSPSRIPGPPLALMIAISHVLLGAALVAATPSPIFNANDPRFLNGDFTATPGISNLTGDDDMISLRGVVNIPQASNVASVSKATSKGTKVNKTAAANQDLVEDADGIVLQSLVSLIATDFPSGWQKLLDSSASASVSTGAWSGDPSKPLSEPFRDGDIDYIRRQYVPWPLGRISSTLTLQRDSFDSYIYRKESAGQGVSVYVVDTGISKTATFASRIRPGMSIFPGNDTDDPHGHGTSIASAIVDGWLGIAPEATVVPVRVMNDMGSAEVDSVVAGLKWIYDNAIPGKSIVNLSLTLAQSDDVDAAVYSLYEKNIAVFSAAGNYRGNACAYSPAGAPGTFTVAASDINDRLMDFSNWGSCVNIIAPGYHAATAWRNGTWNLSSGTSIATAYVSGVAALFLSDPTSQITKVSDLFDMINRAASTYSVSNDGQANTTGNILYNQPDGAAYNLPK